MTQQQLGRLEEVRGGQEALLTDVSTTNDLNLAVCFQPANEAGGDFYEVSRLADGDFGLPVADVAGHDLSVPFVTGALKALNATFVNAALSPCDSMSLLNAKLTRFLGAE